MTGLVEIATAHRVNIPVSEAQEQESITDEIIRTLPKGGCPDASDIEEALDYFADIIAEDDHHYGHYENSTVVGGFEFILTADYYLDVESVTTYPGDYYSPPEGGYRWEMSVRKMDLQIFPIDDEFEEFSDKYEDLYIESVFDVANEIEERIDSILERGWAM